MDFTRKTRPRDPNTRWLMCNTCKVPIPDLDGTLDPKTVQCDRHKDVPEWEQRYRESSINGINNR